MRPAAPLATWVAQIAAILCFACADETAPPTPDAGVSRPDPFAPRPDESLGLTNVSANLEEVLEHGALAAACSDYERDPQDARKKLLCGKWMFFHETFGTAGVPEPIVSFLHQNFEDELGRGYGKLGLIPDPNSEVGAPIGLAPSGTGTTAAVPTVAFTCASCHFARLPDGRYAVGAPNHDYEYGKHILAIVGVASLLRPDFDPSAHHPDYVAYLEPFRQKLRDDPDLVNRFVTALLPLIQNPGGPVPTLSVEEEGYYARWRPGTMDFLIAPLPVSDGVHTISKISPLWDIPRDAEAAASGMPHAMLGWTGTAANLPEFLRGFVGFGQGAAATWTAERLEPLADYVYSLSAPKPLATEPDTVSRGRSLFFDQGCIDCHDGPRGSGKRIYTFDELGTDPALMRWLDPDLSGTYCCGADQGTGDGPSHGLKSPRLVGLWAAKRFLHNGAVDSLEQLFCLNGPRTMVTELAFGNQGHEMTCTDLDADQKRALIDYLRSL